MNKTLLINIYNILREVALWINSILIGVVLIVVFYFIFAPARTLLAIARKDLLAKKIDKKSPSYWIRLKAGYKTNDSYLKQY